MAVSMKELTHYAPLTEKTRAVQPAKQMRYIGSQALKKGHTCFEFNLLTGELNPASFEEETDTIHLYAALCRNKKLKLIRRPNCVYECALNKQNALNKFYRMVKTVTDRKKASG